MPVNLAHPELIDAIQCAIHIGHYVFVWTGPGYEDVPLLCAQAMEEAEKMRKNKNGIFAIDVPPGKGHIFAIVDKKRASPHPLLTYLSPKDTLYTWLLEESEVETFFCVGVIPELDMTPVYGRSHCYFSVSEEELGRRYPYEASTNGWKRGHIGALHEFTYQIMAKCGTPPTPEMIFNARRMKRYHLPARIKMA